MAAFNPTVASMQGLLNKLSDNDPDGRYMSLSDLHEILVNPKVDLLRNDYAAACRFVDAAVQRIDDQNGEVQNLAVRIVGPLAAKIPGAAIATLLEKLSLLKIDHSVDNSIPALALRNAITSLPRPVPGISYTQEVLATYSTISRVLVPRLLGVGDVKSLIDEENPTTESMDVLIELVRCYGPLMQTIEVEKLEQVVLGVLEKSQATSPVKKRAVLALAMLAPHLSDAVLKQLVGKLADNLASHDEASTMRTRLAVTIAGSLARSISHKFNEHLPVLVPHVLAVLSQAGLETQLEAINDGEDQPSQDFNELREAALIALEAFLASCGAAMRPYTEDTIGACLRYLKYDPNYAADEDEEMEEDEDEEEDEEDEDEDDFNDDFDDDDDASWKVRRCAAKALYTLISTRSTDLLENGTLYNDVARPLVHRFNEREESVRLEIIGTMSLLIRKTGEGIIRSGPIDGSDDLLQSLPESRKRRRQSSGGNALSAKAAHSAGMMSPTREEVPQSGPRADLSNITPQIVRTTAKLLKGKQIASKQSVINLLDDLISVQNGGLSDYFDQVMQPTIAAIKGATGSAASSSTALSGGATTATATTLRVAVLNFLSDIAKTHSSSLFQPYLTNVIAGIESAVRDRFYKISSEAIRTTEELVKALTPPRSRLTSHKYKAELQKLYDIVTERASANDVDTEVRQKAIQALGTLLSRTSGPDAQDLLPADKRATGLSMLLERLRNETTRLHAVRAVDAVAAKSSTPGSLDAAWIRQVALELCGQLRKANRALRGASVQALQHLVLSPATKGALDAVTVDGILEAVLPAIDANDTHLLSPGLLVLAQLQQQNPALINRLGFIEGLCDLLRKNIGGVALESLIELVVSVGKTGKGEPLMGGVLRVGIGGDPSVVGKVAGALFAAGDGKVGVEIDSFITELKTAPDETRQSLALAILGEIGLRLGEKSPLKPNLFLEQFHEEPDKVSISAAVALGRAGAGNVEEFLPIILTAIKQEGGHQYLLLQSVREILQQVVASSIDISAYEDQIWQLLFSASQVEDNKAICAECIGRLTLIEPKTYIPKLQELLRNELPAYRAVAVQAIRYTLPDSDESFDAMVKTVLVDMLFTVLQDGDMEIRRLGMTTLNSATHNKPDLILPHLGQLVPYVMQESVVKQELIREVQMGPFKHLVDDGLEVRKSAYETLYALMETAFSRVSSLEFYDRIIAGLNDEQDIRSLCNLMLSKLIVIDPEEITRRLDSIAECYRKILSTKLKDGSVKQEVEKQEEANKSALRITLLLAEKTKTALPGAAAATNVSDRVQHPVWQLYWEWVNKDFERQLKHLKEENRET